MGLLKSGDAASRFSAYVEGLAIRRRLKRRYAEAATVPGWHGEPF
jgi:hypothetical protein